MSFVGATITDRFVESNTYFAKVELGKVAPKIIIPVVQRLYLDVRATHFSAF